MLPASSHPPPELYATPIDPGIEFRDCWARLVRQWLLPVDPLAEITLSMADLRRAASELFSAGGVHQAALQQRLIELFGELPAATIRRLGS